MQGVQDASAAQQGRITQRETRMQQEARTQQETGMQQRTDLQGRALTSVEAPVLYDGKPISLTALLGEMRQENRGRTRKMGIRGKQAGSRNENTGRHCGYTMAGNISEDKVDFVATLRTAAFHRLGEENAGHKFRIHAQDIRYKRYIGKEKMGFLFVVDASRSQGAQKRLAFAKGAILSLLKEVYCRRDQAGLIIFGNRQARLVLPFTRSVEYAGKMLEHLPASGNTPLAMGLRKALETAQEERRKDAYLHPVIVVITDGKANYDERAGNPLDLALEAADAILEAGIAAVVIDTEKGIFSLGLAKKLADKMGARYLTL